MRNFLNKRLLALESKSNPAAPVEIVLVEVADRTEAKAALAWCNGSSYPLRRGKELPSIIRVPELAKYWPKKALPARNDSP
jgi:hypothetical protein